MARKKSTSVSLPDIQYDGKVSISRLKDKCNDVIHLINSLFEGIKTPKDSSRQRDYKFLKALHEYIGAEVAFMNEEHANGDDPKEYEVRFVQNLVNLEVEIFKKIYRE